MKKQVKGADHKKGKDRRFGHHFVDFYNSSLAYGRKKRNRIRYLNWACELLGCSDEKIEKGGVTELSDEDKTQIIDEETNNKVREAVERLTPSERQFIEYFYFQDKTYREISHLLNKKTHKLEKIHHRALNKLKIRLSEYVKTRFGLDVQKETNCMICQSPFRRELDKLIKAKKEEETYKPLMRILNEKYGLEIKSPQVIIGHKKKHMI